MYYALRVSSSKPEHHFNSSYFLASKQKESLLECFDSLKKFYVENISKDSDNITLSIVGIETENLRFIEVEGGDFSCTTLDAIELGSEDASIDKKSKELREKRIHFSVRKLAMPSSVPGGDDLISDIESFFDGWF